MSGPGRSDAALVRETLEEQYADALNPLYPKAAFEALDRLAAAAEKADEAEREHEQAYDGYMDMQDRCLRAEAALLAAQQEREGYRLMVADERRAVKRAEATVTRPREAIEYALTYDLSENTGYYDVRSVLSAALAQDREPKPKSLNLAPSPIKLPPLAQDTETKE